MVIWNATCWPPVAASPESWLSALPRLPPVWANTLTKPGGSVPPLLKKVLSEVATLRWLMLRPPVPICCWPERRREVQDRVGRGVAQARGEAGREAGGGEAAEGTGAAARGREDGVGARDVGSRPEHRLHGAGEARGTRDVGAVGSRGRDLDDVGGGRRQHQVALHGQGADRVAGRERAAVDGGVADRAVAAEHAAGVDRDAGIGDRAVHRQRAGIDGGRPGISVDARQRQRAGADLHKRSAGAAEGPAVGDDAAHLRREVVAADRELLRAQRIASCAFDGAGRHARSREPGHVENATAIGDEACLPAGAVLRENDPSAIVHRDGRVGGRAESPKASVPARLLVIVAVPAELALLKPTKKVLVMLALPAVLVSENPRKPLLVMLAFPPCSS